MHTETVHPLIQETWVAHEFFRRLGYDSDNIYVELIPDGVVVRVISKGKIFRLKIGELEDLSLEDFEHQWLDFIEIWNSKTIPDSAAKRIWNESEIAKNAARILTAMSLAGFPTQVPLTPMDSKA